MAKLLERLPAYLETEGVSTSPAAAECVETLASLTDFSAFKAAMLVSGKDDATGRGLGDAVSVGALAASGLAQLSEIDGCVEFAQALDQLDDGGWTELARKPWFVIEKRPSPGATKKSDIVLRYNYELDLPVADLAVLMGDYTDRRKAWDEMQTGSKVLHEFSDEPSRSDRVVKITLKLPYLVRLAGVPSEMTLRTALLADQPAPGEYTTVAAAWDEAAGKVDLAHAFFKLSLGVLRPHPTDPSKSRFTGIERMGIGSAPDWLLGLLASQFGPKMMASQVDKYAAAKRAGIV